MRLLNIIAIASKRYARAGLKPALAFLFLCVSSSAFADFQSDVLSKIEAVENAIVFLDNTTLWNMYTELLLLRVNLEAEGKDVASIKNALNSIKAQAEYIDDIQNHLLSVVSYLSHGLDYASDIQDSNDEIRDTLESIYETMPSAEGLTGLATDSTLQQISAKLDQISDKIPSAGSGGSSSPSDDEALMDILQDILTKIPNSLSVDGLTVNASVSVDDFDFDWTPLLSVIQNQFELADDVIAPDSTLTYNGWNWTANNLGKGDIKDKRSIKTQSITASPGDWISALLQYQSAQAKIQAENGWGLVEIAALLAPTNTDSFLEDQNIAIDDAIHTSEVEDFNATNTLSGISFDPLINARTHLINVYKSTDLEGTTLPSMLHFTVPSWFNFQTGSINISTANISQYCSNARLIFRLIYWSLLVLLLIYVFRFAVLCYCHISKIITGNGSPVTGAK